MKRVLILANSSGGLYDFRNELLTELLKDCEVVASLPDEVKKKELIDEGVRVVHTAINRRGVNPKEDMALVRAYKRLLRDEKPDLVLTYTIKPNIYGGYCARKLGIPYITTITGLGSTFQKEGVLKKLIVAMYQAGIKGASCVFFQNSENMRIFDELKIKGKEKRLVPGSGVNLERHPFEPYPDPVHRDDFDVINLLYIGRTMKEKGTDELLEAAEAFGKTFEAVAEAKKQGTEEAEALTVVKPEFQLLGYPDEDYQEKLDEYEKKGYIRQLGFDPDVQPYLRAAHAVVLPTYHEGMSNVLQEAAAAGRPVIASNIPGCREIFDDGVTGIACERKSVSSLAEAVNTLIHLSQEKRAEMGKAAREKMEREFDRRKVVAAYMEEINKVLYNETGGK